MPDAQSPETLTQQSLAEIVANDSRTADVFERFGLDYCCRGQQSLETATRERRVALPDVVAALDALGPPTAADRLPHDWNNLDALTRYIVERHHRYVASTIPAIRGWLDKLVDRHGARHVELREVRDTFIELADELTTHMAKEESLLFPFINELAAAERARTRLPRGPFGTILHPVRVMESDHEEAGELLQRLRYLTRDYQPPSDGCTTYQLCYRELERFEADLHRHVHLENNLLFPQAMALEASLS